MFNIAICSNNKDEIKVLNKFLNEISNLNDFEFNLYTYSNLDKILNNCMKKIDILILDAQLDDRKWVDDVENKLQNKFNNVQVLYLCEIVNFMINGFKLKDHRYVLKPLKYKDVEQELMKLINTVKIKESYKNNYNPIEINLYNSLEGMSTNDIYYIEASKSGCIAITNKSAVHLPYTIQDLEKKLNPNIFFRCNEDCIINLKKISKIGRYFVISKSCEILVSEEKFNMLKKQLKILLNL